MESQTMINRHNEETIVETLARLSTYAEVNSQTVSDHEKRIRFLERLVNGLLGVAGATSIVLRFFGH